MIFLKQQNQSGSWARNIMQSRVYCTYFYKTLSYTVVYVYKTDISAIRQDIVSRIWCTYRKSFVPIGGVDGLTTDKGWGCMLRCGQMVLAQALVSVHLGRDWFWEPDTKDPVYLKILRRFEDKRQAPYSIHQIAQMGASEGKEVGQWFGPNTVAQVLKYVCRNLFLFCSCTKHLYIIYCKWLFRHFRSIGTM